MKKLSKILIVSLLALVMVIAMAACGGAKPSGKFVLDEFSVKVGEVEISGKISELEDKLEELEEELEPGELLGLSIMLAMFSNFSLTFDGDNLIAKMGVLTVGEGTFTMDGNKIVPVIESDEEEEEDLFTDSSVTYENGKIVFSMNNDGTEIKLIFKQA